MKSLFAFFICLCFSGIISAQNGISSFNIPATFPATEMRYRSGIASDAYGNLWVAFQFNGLAKFDGNNWSFYNTTNSPLINDTILSLYTYNNYLYVGTIRGLSCYNGFGWTSWSMADGLAGNEINGIYCDSQGLIVASQQHISIQNGSSWNNIQIPGSDHSTNGYFAYQYYHTALFKDAAGKIWVGRRDAGLQIYNGSTWLIQTIMGSPVNQPRAIARDDQGRIWVGGNELLVYNGSYLMRPEQYIPDWHGYTPSGINAFARSPQGELFFTGGFIYSYRINNNNINTLAASFYRSNNAVCCFHNGNFNMISLVSDSVKVYVFNASAYCDFGNFYSVNAFKNLDGNMVKAHYGTRGMLFWDGIGNPCYEVPRGSGKHSLFASGLWLGGRDAGNNLHVAMQKYRQGGDDLYSGPVRSYGPGAGTTDTLACIPYDRIWKINKWEIDSFRSWYNNGTLGTGTHTIPEVIASWPAHGDTAEGFDFYLAPFVDTDGDGVYRPALGDYPLIRGTQMLWWVYNDVLGPHTESGGLPLGVEVRASAYIYGCDTFSGTTNAINYTTFLHYEIINRSANTYHDCFAGIWTDADLGDHADDYTGCNVGQNSFYFYNGDNQDGNGNGKTYGTNPPAISTAILNGPWAPLNDGIDNDKDGITDEPFESTGMSSFMYFNNSGAATGDPQTAEECLYYMQGRWRDGSHMTYGGTGYNSSSVECQFMFPGRPTTDPYGWGTGGVPMGDWSEESENNSPADRRGIAGMGPFNWAPGEIHYIDLAFVWSRAFTGQAWASVEKNFVETAQIIDWYHNGGPQPWLYGGNFPYCDIQPMSVTEPMVAGDKMRLYPNPASDNVFVLLPAGSGNCRLEITNTNGQIADCKTFSGKTEFNVSNYPPGIYFVRAVGERYTGSVKMVVQ